MNNLPHTLSARKTELAATGRNHQTSSQPHAAERRMRSGSLWQGAMRFVPIMALAVLALSASTCDGGGSSTSTCAPSKWGYTATWKSTTQSTTGPISVTLTDICNQTIQNPQTTGSFITNFQTEDPHFKCLNGSSLNVWTAPDQFPNRYIAQGECTDASGTVGEWTFPYPPPSRHYSAYWNGQQQTLSPLSNAGKVSDLPDAVPQAQVTNFDTDDTNYQCFEGQSIPVFYAAREHPAVYVVQGTCADGTVGTWTFARIFVYTANWMGQPVSLKIVASSAGDVSKLPDAAYLGDDKKVTNFYSDEQNFSCFYGQALKVWRAPAEYPDLYIVQDVCPSGTRGTWTFPQHTGATPTPTPTPTPSH